MSGEVSPSILMYLRLPMYKIYSRHKFLSSIADYYFSSVITEDFLPFLFILINSFAIIFRVHKSFFSFFPLYRQKFRDGRYFSKIIIRLNNTLFTFSKCLAFVFPGSKLRERYILWSMIHDETFIVANRPEVVRRY